MKRSILSVALIGLGLSVSGSVLAGSVQHVAHAVEHSAGASAHVTLGSTKAVMGTASIPLRAIGAVGKVTQRVGDTLRDFSKEGVSEPLPISEKRITIGPNPHTALMNVNHNE